MGRRHGWGTSLGAAGAEGKSPKPAADGSSTSVEGRRDYFQRIFIQKAVGASRKKAGIGARVTKYSYVWSIEVVSAHMFVVHVGENREAESGEWEPTQTDVLAGGHHPTQANTQSRGTTLFLPRLRLPLQSSQHISAVPGYLTAQKNDKTRHAV